MKKKKKVKKQNFMENIVTKEVKVAVVILPPKCFGTFEEAVCIEVFCEDYTECKVATCGEK